MRKLSTSRSRTLRYDNAVVLGHTGDTFLGTNVERFYIARKIETCIDSTHKGPPYKTGGSLSISKARYEFSPSAVFVRGGQLWSNTRMIPSFFGNSPAVPTLLAPTNYSSLESKGWAKFRPGKPEANFGQFLGELSMIPTIPLRQILKARNSLDRFRGMGGEYLNVQFGWLPFVKDLQDMYKLTKNLDKRLAQLRRDNGRSVRRRGSVYVAPVGSTVVSSTTSTGGYMYPTFTSASYFTLNMQRNVYTTDETKAWFSARFRYFVRDIGSLRWENRAVAALFGLNPTPSLLWELLPFSWLIDWAVNVGDVLSNMSSNAVDNLVAEYAYTMVARTFTEKVDEQAIMKLSNGSPFPVAATATRIRETKQRFRASPFGIGLVPSSLSGKQALILSALGISRRW